MINGPTIGQMRLTPDRALALLRAESHGVLSTLHPEHGPDPQPVVYALGDDGHVGVPIDTVKAKGSGPLQREHNLAADPRAALLIEHWDAGDWSRLWWVKARLHHLATPDAALSRELAERLSSTVPQYAEQPFRRLLVCRVVAVSGWTADASA